MEGVITRAFVIRTGTERYVGRFNDDVKLISANFYASDTSARRDLLQTGDKIVAVNIEIDSK